MAIFKRGFNAVSEEKKRQEDNQKKGNGIWNFFLKGDGDEADVTFLTDEPVSYYEHQVKSYKNGKEFYNNVPCLGKECVHCQSGERPTFKSSWLVIDHREVAFTDKEGTEHVSDANIRMFTFGTKVSSQLDRLNSKYGLANRTLTVIRMGKGTATSYSFERGEVQDIDTELVSELLPESVSSLYDGSVDSLYTIVENQIMLKAEASTEVEEKVNPNKNLVSLEEDEQPKKFKKLSRTRVENSVKSNIKSALKRK